MHLLLVRAVLCRLELVVQAKAQVAQFRFRLEAAVQMQLPTVSGANALGSTEVFLPSHTYAC